MGKCGKGDKYMVKIIIWGTGFRSKEFMNQNIFADSEIICFVDSYKKNDMFFGYHVILPSEVNGYEYDYVIIPLVSPVDVYEQCISLGIPDDKIIVVNNCIADGYIIHKQEIETLKSIPALYNYINKQDMIRKQQKPIRRCLLDYCETYDPRIKSVFNDYEYTRYRTFELASREVRNIPGDWSIAELGVWKGGTSRFLSLLFPERTIYMFDTFESFDPEEVKKEIASGHCNTEFSTYFLIQVKNWFYHKCLTDQNV